MHELALVVSDRGHPVTSAEQLRLQPRDAPPPRVLLVKPVAVVEVAVDEQAVAVPAHAGGVVDDA